MGQTTTNTYRLVLTALIAAVGMLLGYIETLVPLPVPVPGIKLGFANIAILFALYAVDVRMAVVVAVVKLLVTTFAFGSPFMALFSLAGTALALLVMALLKKTGKMGIVGVSSCAAVAHNIGQLCVAMLVLENQSVWALAPVLVIAGVATGLITGLLASGTLRATEGILKKAS